MKLNYLYTVSIALLFLAACSRDNDELPGGGNNPRPDALRIEVRVNDFMKVGGTNTRATDNGAATTFENGDRIGIIAFDANGRILSDNVPYIYNSGTWSFDSGNGKTAIYYDSKASYLAYFPYSAAADGVAGIEDLKAKFPPLYDQRTKEAYRASDLLVWSAAGGASSKSLEIVFDHAYSSLLLSPQIKCTINGSEDFSYHSSLISDVNLSMNKTPQLPYKDDDGNYRMITEPKAVASAGWFCTYRDKTYSGTLAITALAAKTRYTSAPVIRDLGDYTLDNAQVGDFYCKSSDGNTGYLIPNDALSLPTGVDCIGIVYWVGSVVGDNYGLLDAKFPDGMHGLVVSLWEAVDPGNGSTDGMSWTYSSYEFVNYWLNDATWSGIPRPSGFQSIQVTDKNQGYANTIALQEYNTYVENNYTDGSDKDQTYRIKPIYALANFETTHPAPANSSGWYWPSIYELKYVCWGQNKGQGTAGKNMLNDQIGRVGGTTFGNDDYWSSSETSYSSSNAWYVYFYRGSVYYNGNKDSNTYRVRPLLAF